MPPTPRDPLHRQIVEALGGHVDPTSFQQCVGGLLRAVYPGLVVTWGGADGGVDGVDAVAAGVPRRLVATTGANVARNLRESLQSIVASGGAPGNVILATSQPVSAARRRTLENTARKLGFTLQQIHERVDLASRLYESPKWRLELLGIGGTVQALSIEPRTDRPVSQLPLVGRDEDLQWLAGRSADSLVVGQPGAGKTSLHLALARQGAHRFVVVPEIGAIADAIREEKPRSVIVDDAHSRLDQLRDLRLLRETTGLSFNILANCWPGDADAVRQAMQLPEESVRELAPLNQDQIASVVEAFGIAGPPQLIQEIVEQSVGKPGLAVTLAQLCLGGDVTRLRLGDALGDEVALLADRLIGRTAVQLMGVLSLGGDAGADTTRAAEGLGLALAEAQAQLNKLALAGLIHQTAGGCVAVIPAALRHVLVRRTFFEGVALPLDRFRSCARDPQAMLYTLLGARHRGARVADEVLFDLLAECGDVDAFQEYAWLGADESRRAIERFPNRLLDIAPAALAYASQSTIPLLLSAAAATASDPGDSPKVVNNPMRLLATWIESGRPGLDVALRRRDALIEAGRDWIRSGGHRGIGVQALAIALTPSFSDSYPKAGSGRTIIFERGTITTDECHLLLARWSAVLEELSQLPEPPLQALRQLIESWAYPTLHGPNVSPEHLQELQAGAVLMLRDTMALPTTDAAFRRWAKAVVAQLDLGLEIDLDPEFEAVFPIERSRRNFHAEHEQFMEAIRGLADRWAASEPMTIARRLHEFERLAREGNISWPDLRREVAEALASRVGSPDVWLTAMVEVRCSGTIAQPFMDQLTEHKPPGWEDALRTCLSLDEYRRAAIDTVLRCHDCPEALVDDAIRAAPQATIAVYGGCAGNRFPVPVVKRLLKHEDVSVASSAAIATSIASRSGGVDPTIREEWTEAIIRTVDGDAHVEDVLESDPTLACQWLKIRLQGPPNQMWKSHRIIEAAASVLTQEQRLSLLPFVTAECPRLVVTLIVADDSEVQRRLLDSTALRDLHLAALAGKPVGRWVDKAIVTLDAGYGAKEIVRASYSSGQTWSGPESAMWQEWVEAFGRLVTHADPRVQELARLGQQAAESRKRACFERERFEAVHGMLRQTR